MRESFSPNKKKSHFSLVFFRLLRDYLETQIHPVCWPGDFFSFLFTGRRSRVEGGEGYGTALSLARKETWLWYFLCRLCGGGGEDVGDFVLRETHVVEAEVL